MFLTRADSGHRRARRGLLAVACLAALSCGPKKAPKAENDDWTRRYQLGLEQLRQGRPDLARVALESVAQQQPDNALVLYSLGLAYYGVRDLPRARETFQALLVVDPFFTDAHNMLGVLYAETGERAVAQKEFLTCLADRRYQRPWACRYNLGSLLLEDGKTEEALAHLRTAAKMQPENADYRFSYGKALATTGRADEAFVEYEAALTLKPDHDGALYQTALLLLEQGQAGRARDYLRKATELAPGSEGGRLASEKLRQLQDSPDAR